MARKIEIQVVGDTKQLEAALGKAQQKTSKFGSALSAAAKVSAVALGGLGLAAKVGFDELAQGQKVAAQTAAVIKSTGGAANVSAKQVQSLANALLQKSGVDDEAIASGENLLLTFRNVRDEAGRGKDIFTQATKATLDLSVAMGQDMKSSAIQVGKALNDPVKGLTALRRIGVGFSADQEALIKHLVKTGHTMQAQKIILGELRKEFGGSAAAAGKTMGGQLSLLRENAKNLAANLVQSLLPALQNLVGALSAATGWMQKNQGATKVIIAAIGTLSAAFITAAAANALWNSSLVAMIGQERIAAVASRLLGASLLGIPVVAIAAGVIALGAALVIAYRKSATFRAIVNAAFNAVKSAGAAAASVISEAWRRLRDALGGIINAIRSKVQSFTDKVRSVADSASGPLGRVAGFFQSIVDKVSNLIGWIRKIHWPSPPSWLSGGLLSNFAAGVQNFAGGLAVVGEKGPELVHLPRGSDVFSAAVSRGMMRPAAAMAGPSRSRGQPLEIRNVIMLDGRVVYDALAAHDKIYRRQNGRGKLDPPRR